MSTTATKHVLRIPLSILLASLFAISLAGSQSALASGPTTTDFENFLTGDLNMQAGWTSGHGSSFCPVYDVEVVPNTYGYPSFGAKSLRISNAITCGSYDDQTLSPSLTDEAGETAASTGTYSGGTRQSYFEAQWDFASTVPGSEQPGLSVVASADRGDPSRMTWLQMMDTASGLQLNFQDYQHSLSDFVITPIATGLDRTVPHTVKMTVQFIDGPANDVVKIYLDGALIHTGTTLEDYYRDWTLGVLPAPVDSMMFRTGGTAAPAVSGNGFLIDNFSSFSGPVPTADLTGLSLSSGTLSPAFDPATTAYAASVDNATTNLAVSANASPGATAVVSGGTNLTVGANTVTITVTTDDGTTTKTYTVTVDRAAAPAGTPAPQAPAPASLGTPQSFGGVVQGSGVLVLYWQRPAGNPAVAHYTIWKDGKAIGATNGSSYQLVVPNPVVGDTSIFQVSADDGNGTTSPLSQKLTGVPDLAGLTAAQARALLLSRGFTPGTITTKPSSQPTNTVIGQDPWPLPAYRPLGTTINTVISVHTEAASPLVVKVSTSRRIPLATKHSLTPRILTTIAATAHTSLTGYRNIRKTYATWSTPLKAGANYLTLKIPAHLKIKLPGIYRLTIKVQSSSQSKLYSVPLRLASRTFTVPLPKREADILLLTTPTLTGTIIRQLSARYQLKTVDTQTVFTKTSAPNERVGAVVLDANEAGLNTIRHLHLVFPDLHIIAIVDTPATSKLAKNAGASTTIVKPATPRQLTTKLTQALKTTLGK